MMSSALTYPPQINEIPPRKKDNSVPTVQLQSWLTFSFHWHFLQTRNFCNLSNIHISYFRVSVSPQL